jgi:hypothetical protein
MSEHPELEEALDHLIEHFGARPYDGEIVEARAAYAARTGRVFEEDELYEARTAAFLEWYAVERPLGGAGVPPAVVAYREADAAGQLLLRALCLSHRSLFAVTALDEGEVMLTDLVGGGRFRVAERRRLFGVSVGDIVEARLVGYGGRVVFGRTFGYHPAVAREAILSHVRRICGEGGTRADAVDYVASLRVRAERYKHVAAERVYEAATTEFPPLKAATGGEEAKS